MNSIKDNLTSAAWWKAAGIRALRTALVVAITYVPASATAAVPYTVLGSAAVVAGLLSFLTSLAGIAEVDGATQPWYFALLSRVVKSISQALVAGVLANVVFLSDINWSLVLATTITAGVGSLLLGVLKTLPESDQPIAPITVPVVGSNGTVGGALAVVTQSTPAAAKKLVSGENPDGTVG